MIPRESNWAGLQPLHVALVLAVVAGACGGGTADGPGDPAAGAAIPETEASRDAVVPFTIDVPEPVLVDLHERLTRARFPDQLENVGWTYGTDLAYLKELVAYWRDEFDWREQERRLNRFEQFTTNIDGLDIHFIHRRSTHPNALPLIITHGWPGSFVEFHKIIEPLTDPVSHGGQLEDAFDLIIPSIPGYGFSDKPRQPGYNPERMAEIFVTLMARLGYTRYGTQGGDYGSLISTVIGRIDPDHVAGVHLNLCSGGPPPGVDDPTAGVPFEELEKMRERRAFWTDEERGYSAIQGSKPQTIGYALNDSPVGLAAWIVEKFRAWSDVDGDVESKFTKDELLTNITVYWVTQTATSAARLYYELRHPPAGSASTPAGRLGVPTGCAAFPKEISFTPRRWLEARYNLAHFTVMPHGGHFAALEEPELLVEDIRAFFRDLR